MSMAVRIDMCRLSTEEHAHANSRGHGTRPGTRPHRLATPGSLAARYSTGVAKNAYWSPVALNAASNGPPLKSSK